MLKIGWFSTGRDEAAGRLLQTVQDSIHSGGIKGKISFVFSNREPGEAEESDLFFKLVHSYDIPLVYFSHRKFKTLLLERSGTGETEAKQSRENWRLKYDREIHRRIEEFTPGICVLAGYMLIVGEELCRKYNMINLHPAPPDGPTGSWQEVIRKLLQDKAEKAGAMMHLVTPELDRGPVISYCTFSIRGEPFAQYWQKNDKNTLFCLIRRHELAREFPLIISTLQALSQGELNLRGDEVIDARGNSIGGYDLSSEIDKMVKSNIASLAMTNGVSLRSTEC
ncbi:MAG: phosphoglycerate transporter [Dehalococcoidia bacterium]|nr:phosphoglycerate transporter [Dehalococcoidia bacterium]